MNISHVGIGSGKGLTFELASGLKIAPGTQANFAHYNKLAKRGSAAGICDLATAGSVAVGVLVDCSAKGDSVTVEAEGYEWVKYTGTAPAYGEFVTQSAGTAGVVELVAITAFVDDTTAASPTAAQLRSGVWQVDEVDTVNSMVLIDLEVRL